MGSEKKCPLLPLLLPILLHSCLGQVQHCSSRSHGSLHCYNDFINNITCVWNSTVDYKSVGADTECTVRAHFLFRRTRKTRKEQCQLMPVNYSIPAIRSCSIVFNESSTFTSHQEWSINVTCDPLEHSLVNITYKPVYHIKLNAPGIPVVNFTSVHWSLVHLNGRIPVYSYQLQWKNDAQAWEELKLWNISDVACHTDCQELIPEWLEAGERYQVRVRVQASTYCSDWSDWSPTACWVSPVGSTPSTLDALEWDSVVCTIVGAAVTLSLAVLLYTVRRGHWVQKIGPAVPNPRTFFLHEGNIKTWLNPYLTSESFHSFLPVEISPVEVSTPVDAVMPRSKEASLPEDRRCESSCLSIWSISNFSYSHLCIPPISSLTGRNLEPCAADSPYGPVNSHGEEVGGGKDNEDEKAEEMEILELLSDDSSVSGTTTQVSFHYDRVEELEAWCCGLQGPDSGMVCGEEEHVIQDSLEDADRINLTAGHGDSGSGGGGGFGGGAIVSRGSIQVSLDYERMEILHALHCGLQSPDSGMVSRGEEQASQNSLEEEVQMNVTGAHDEEELRKHWEEERGRQELMENLVSPSGGGVVVSRGSMQVYSDYEKVGNLHA